jgi:HD superfamily phosphohydrolase YqeK
MERIKIAPILTKIKKELALHPYDAAHDLNHHLRVFKGSRKIVAAEYLNADNKVLTIAAWGHDLGGRTGQETTGLKKFLEEFGCSNDFIAKILLVIEEHSFGKKQTRVESRVLFDADKLEYVNPLRLTSFIQAAHRGLLDKNAVQHYLKEWHERVYRIPDMLHYSYSKKEFARLLPEAERIMRNRT